MTTPQLTTLGLAVAAAVGAVLWAIREGKRDPGHLPLNEGLRVSHVLAGLAVVVATIPLLWLVFSRELLPKDSPAVFGVFLGAYAVATVATILAVAMRLVRRDATGWLTLGEGTVRLEAPGIDEDLALETGTVVAFPVGGKPQWLQLRLPLRDGRTFLLLALVPIKRLQWAEGRAPVAPQGLVLGGGAKQLCDRLEPFIDR